MNSAREVLARLPVVQVTGRDGDDVISRPMHGAVVGAQVVFHGGGERPLAGLLDREVLISGAEIVARIPSWFVDPRRACPATTLYFGIRLRGELRAITDPAAKAAALHAYSARLQPEGGFEPITADARNYRGSLDRLFVAGVALDGLRLEAKLGADRPPGWRQRVLAGLWGRGAAGDLEAIEQIRHAAPTSRLPSAFDAPEGVALHCVGTAAELAPAVALLAPQYWNEQTPPEAIRIAHQNADAWVVARAEGRLVGTARAISDRGKRAWIYDVAVRPGWRGRGVGRAVMRLLLDHPQLRDAQDVLLGTRDAMRFYARLGFERFAGRSVTMRRAG